MIFIDFHGFPMDFHDVPWIAMDFHDFPWISMDFHGFPWKSMDFHGFLWIAMDFHGHGHGHGRWPGGAGRTSRNLFRRDLGRVEESRAGTEATPPFVPPRSLMET